MCPRDQRGRTPILNPLGRFGQHRARIVPLLGRRQARQLAIVEAFEQDRRRTTRSDPLLHSLVELAIVDLGRCPAHAADQADFPQAILPIPFGLSLSKSRPSVLSLEGRTVLRQAQDERKERKSTRLNTSQ